MKDLKSARPGPRIVRWAAAPASASSHCSPTVRAIGRTYRRRPRDSRSRSRAPAECRARRHPRAYAHLGAEISCGQSRAHLCRTPRCSLERALARRLRLDRFLRMVKSPRRRHALVEQPERLAAAKTKLEVLARAAATSQNCDAYAARHRSRRPPVPAARAQTKPSTPTPASSSKPNARPASPAANRWP